MSASFTPGPWSLGDGNCLVGPKGQFDFLPILSPFVDGAFDEDDEAALGNMRLIASAPDLYEALDKAAVRLEAIRARLCRLSAYDGTAKAELVDYIRQCEAEAETDLRKARGES